MRVCIAVVLSAVAASPAHGQVPDWVAQIIAAAELPVVAAQARNDGIAADQVRTAIEAMRRSRVRAADARGRRARRPRGGAQRTS